MAFFNKKKSSPTGLQATNDEKPHRIMEKTVRLPEISESQLSSGIENTGISHTDLANSTVKGHFCNDRNEAKRKSSRQQDVGNIGNYGKLSINISTDSAGTNTIVDVRYTDTPELAGNRFDAPEGAIEDSKTIRGSTLCLTGLQPSPPKPQFLDPPLSKTLPDIPDEQTPDKKMVNRKNKKKKTKKREEEDEAAVNNEEQSPDMKMVNRKNKKEKKTKKREEGGEATVNSEEPGTIWRQLRTILKKLIILMKKIFCKT